MNCRKGSVNALIGVEVNLSYSFNISNGGGLLFKVSSVPGNVF